MTKTVLEAMKLLVVNELGDIALQLKGVSDGESTDEKTGVTTDYKRFEVEVPKGYGPLSHCRFSAKVLGSKVSLTEEEIDNFDFSVIFKGLEVSFISEKGQVYFRAKEAVVKREE